MTFFRFLITKHPVLAAMFAMFLVGSIWFAYGFIREAVYFADRQHQQQQLEYWMSPRYVGKSWDLEPETIVRIMELEPNHAQPTLRQVTAHLGISLRQLEVRVRRAKAEQERRVKAGIRRSDPSTPARPASPPGQTP